MIIIFFLKRYLIVFIKWFKFFMTIKIKNDRYLFENGLFLKVYLHNVKQKVKN